MTDSKLQIWLMACRPRTLTAAISPVMIGSVMAFGDGVHHIPSAFLCLLAALSIQIGTNLANDYFDYKKGADSGKRIGPTRVTQAGLIKPEAIKWAFILTFLFSAFICFLLFKRGGAPIAIIGILSITSGILYTAGPKPLGYVGLGDLFVLIFFGPVAVGGTYYVQSFEMNYAILLAGLAPGLISVAILTVNNYRDIENDRKIGKRTLAVRFGRSFAQREYLYCLVGASLLPVLIYGLINDHQPILLCTITLVLAIPTIQTVFTKTDGPSLNTALAMTGKLLLIYSVLFSIGWIL